MMNKPKRIIIAGFGGQGIMLLGQILAYAGNERGLRTLWYPSYGPETRGGTANCSVTIAKEEIASPVFAKADSLIAMNLPSLNKFQSKVNENGHLFYNSSLIKDYKLNLDLSVYQVPVNDLALELGNPRVANMIMLGSYLEITKLFEDEFIIQVLSNLIKDAKEELIEINKAALKCGRRYIQDQYLK